MAKEQALGKRRGAWLVGLGALHLSSLTLYRHSVSDCGRPSHHLSLWLPTSAALKLFPPRAVPSSSLISTVALKSLPETTFSEELGFLVSSSQSFHVCLPITSLCPRTRGCGPRPVAQCGSAAQSVFHHHFCVSIFGLTKPFASHLKGQDRVMVYKSDSIWIPSFWVSSVWRDLEFVVGEA